MPDVEIVPPVRPAPAMIEVTVPPEFAGVAQTNKPEPLSRKNSPAAQVGRMVFANV